MNVKISITLPSIYPEALDRALANIRAATRNEYEVLVVSSFPVEDPNVVWIEETERRGCAFAHDLAAQHATGDFITAFADDWLYADGWDEKILPDFLERERQWGGEYLMGLRYDHWELVGTVFGIYYANFPFMRRSNLDRYGWIGPDYRLGFGDADLSLRIWNRGGRCEYSREKVLSITEDDGVRKKTVALFSPEDLQIFISRWVPIYGKGIKTDDIRDFNLDVRPEDLEGVPEQRTIYGNDPKYVRVLAENATISQGPPFFVETIKTSNIVSFRGRHFCVPIELGAVDMSSETNRSQPGILSFDTLDEARVAASQTASDTQPYLAESVEGANIVGYGGKFYFCPLSLGPLDLRIKQVREQYGIICCSTIEEARRATISIKGFPENGPYPETPEELSISNLLRLEWYYQIELLPGVVTPGKFGAATLVRRLLQNCAVDGLNCLDIGPMEGAVAAMLAHAGASRVSAIDISRDHIPKINALKHYHGVEIDFHAPVPLAEAPSFFRSRGDSAFDLVVFAGVLYHVLEFTQSLASARALVRTGGIMIVETWLGPGDDMSMKFNHSGSITAEIDTFWFPTVALFDYLLRLYRLKILDCYFFAIDDKQGGGYRLACACQATELPDSGDDNWMAMAGTKSVDAYYSLQKDLPSARTDPLPYVSEHSGPVTLVEWVRKYDSTISTEEDFILRLPSKRSMKASLWSRLMGA